MFDLLTFDTAISGVYREWSGKKTYPVSSGSLDKKALLMPEASARTSQSVSNLADELQQKTTQNWHPII